MSPGSVDGGPNVSRWRGDYQRMDGPGGTERDRLRRSVAPLELRGRDSQLHYVFEKWLERKKKGSKEKIDVNSGFVLGLVRENNTEVSNTTSSVCLVRRNPLPLTLSLSEFSG